jgi:hypothetical protein
MEANQNDALLRARLSKAASGLILICASTLSLFAFSFQNGLAANRADRPPPDPGVALVCKPFEQVNAGAFGLGVGADGDYSSEEGFEVLTFNGRLYVGMEADNSLGARLWRTKSGVTFPTKQGDWEEVVADAGGLPFGVSNVQQNDHIDSLAEFNHQLYVSTANGGGSTYGTRIFRSPSGDPGTWQDAIPAYGPGFGEQENTNFKDMQVFDGHLCGGTNNYYYGAEVWCTADGSTWEQKNVNGFGKELPEAMNSEVWSGMVYQDALYFGVQNLGDRVSIRFDYDDIAKVFRTRDLDGTPVWQEVYSGEPGSRRADLLGDLNGYLYLAVSSDAGIVVLRSAGGDPGSWEQVNRSGMNGDAGNLGTVVDGATVYNRALYVAVTHREGGFELWRTMGALQDSGLVDWEQVGKRGLTDTNNVYAQLVVYNGSLYAWTSNYASGQQMLSSECGLESTLAVSKPGLYDFGDEVGVQIEFSQVGAVTQIAARVYPGAWDPNGLVVHGVTPVKRHFEIAANGSEFTADLSLAYTDEEFAASSIEDENTLYPAVRTGTEWEACPQSQQSRDVQLNMVRCSQMNAFSSMAITGGSSPTVIRLAEFRAIAIGETQAPYWAVVGLAVVAIWWRRRRKVMFHA